MAVFNGTNLLLKAITTGGTLATIGHTTSASMSLSMDTPDATSKIHQVFLSLLLELEVVKFLLKG